MIQAYEGEYQGEKAIWLTADRYEAAVLPEFGGNLIAFRDSKNGYSFLHEPSSMEALRTKPFIHGMPVLFPPNRYEDGQLKWNGEIYNFPVNEEKTGNHLHGFFYNRPWEVERYGRDEASSYVTLLQKVNEKHEVYTYFPHVFTIRLHYSLSENGLEQQVTVLNEGAELMPCLLAFHTTINAPFVSGSSASDYVMRMTIGERRELNERMLPTGGFQPLNPQEKLLKQTGVFPFFEAMDNHYTSQPQNDRNFMELIDRRVNLKLVYDVGTAYKHWMVWNNQATEGFLCPEPQINLVNAPNLSLPAEDTGLVSLKPGEKWRETSHLYCVKMGNE